MIIKGESRHKNTSFIFFSFFFLSLKDRILLCSSEWPQTQRSDCPCLPATEIKVIHKALIFYWIKHMWNWSFKLLGKNLNCWKVFLPAEREIYLSGLSCIMNSLQCWQKSWDYTLRYKCIYLVGVEKSNHLKNVAQTLSWFIGLLPVHFLNNNKTCTASHSQTEP